MNTDYIKASYPPGTRVELNEMLGESDMPCALCGTVRFVDDAAQIHVKWDNKRGLALIPGEDSFKIIGKETEEEEELEL